MNAKFETTLRAWAIAINRFHKYPHKYSGRQSPVLRKQFGEFGTIHRKEILEIVNDPTLRVYNMIVKARKEA